MDFAPPPPSVLYNEFPGCPKNRPLFKKTIRSLDMYSVCGIENRVFPASGSLSLSLSLCVCVCRFFLSFRLPTSLFARTTRAPCSSSPHCPRMAWTACRARRSTSSSSPPSPRKRRVHPTSQPSALPGRRLNCPPPRRIALARCDRPNLTVSRVVFPSRPFSLRIQRTGPHPP